MDWVVQKASQSLAQTGRITVILHNHGNASRLGQGLVVQKTFLSLMMDGPDSQNSV